MKFTLSLIGMLVLAAAAAREEISPIQKVLQMLREMVKHGEEERLKDEVEYTKASAFCKHAQASKASAIEDKQEHIDLLTTQIAKSVEDIAELAQDITKLEKDSDTWSGDRKAAAVVRKLENDDHVELHKGYTSSIDNIKDAVNALKESGRKKKEALEPLLIQVSSMQIPFEAKTAIESFLQIGEENSASEKAKDTNPVIEMLDNIGEKFRVELRNYEKKEADAQGAYEMLESGLKMQMKQAAKDISTKTTEKTNHQSSLAQQKSDKKSTMEQKKGDEAFLADIKSSCEDGARDYEAKQKMRIEEMQAIEKAVAIIEGRPVPVIPAKPAPTGEASKDMKTLFSLGQLRSTTETRVQSRVVQFLHARAKHLDSRVLHVVSLKAAKEPMKKIKKMIKDLVVKLLEEATAEAGHKGWCDKEMATNAATRSDKTDQVAELTASIDSLTASLAKLTKEASDLSDQVAELDAMMGQRTEERAVETKANAETVADATASQTSMAEALIVLKEFYAKAAKGASFLQLEAAVETTEEGKPTGVIGLLEVIQKDFSRLAQTTSSAEDIAQKAYDDFMADSKVSKSGKSAALKYKNEDLESAKAALVSQNNDLADAKNQLSASLAYFDKLKPSCIEERVSYEDRAARRTQEISTLKESLTIIQGDAR